jgi:predicted short-subunit dehydrogenase-like oxidoreductase (DUF2520 family)
MQTGDGSIGIVGAGRVAVTLGRLLFEAGEPVVYVASRDLHHAESAASFIGSNLQAMTYSQFPSSASRLLIAVTDAGLPEVAAILAKRATGSTAALHTCGSFGPEVLEPLRTQGVECGTLHPLQTIANRPEAVSALRGSGFAVWGDRAAVMWAERIVAIAGGTVLRISPENRPLYHAAAVMASNFLMAVIDAGQHLMEEAGIDSETALHAMAPLIRTAVGNAIAQGPVHALTGPIERGDASTVATHLKALGKAPERIRKLYRAAGRQTVDMARRRGLAADTVLQLDQMLTED